MGNYKRPSTRTRSTVTLTWLWIALLTYTGAAIAFLLFSFGTTLFSSSLIGRLFGAYDTGLALLIGLLSLTSMLCSWCVALLIKGRRWAYFVLLFLTLIGMPLAYCSDSDENIYFALVVLGMYLMTWLSLLIHYKGKSAWSTMDNAFDWAHCRHLNVVYLIAFLLFAAVTAGAVLQAPTHAKSSWSLDDEEELDGFGTLNDEAEVDTVPAINLASDYTLNDVLQQANAELPVDIGNGIVFKSVEEWYGILVYFAEVDEDRLSIESMQSNNELRESLRSALDSNDNSLVAALQGLDMGLGYCFVGSMSSDTAYVEFSAEEVAGM